MQGACRIINIGHGGGGCAHVRNAPREKAGDSVRARGIASMFYSRSNDDT
jgi:hypothetical protein